MPVEIREILITTDIRSPDDSPKELTPQQLEQLREEIIAQIRGDKNLGRKVKQVR